MTTPQTYKQLSQLCILKGVLRGKQKNIYIPQNIAIYPFESTRQFYQQLGHIHTIWQKLVYKASIDKKLIYDVFGSIRKNDPWVDFLLTGYQVTNQANLNVLNFIRTDYFIDINQTAKITQYNLAVIGLSSNSQKIYESKKIVDKENSQYYFQNYPFQQFINSIVQHYQRRKLTGLFLILISDNQVITVLEQKLVQFKLMQHGIKCKRVQLADLAEKSVLNNQKELYYNNQLVSFVYYRTGYLLKHFQTIGINKGLEIKKKLAASNVTCIPNVQMQLVNLKRMQAELSKPKVMRKYLTEQEATILQTCIIQNYDLESIKEEEFKVLLQKIEKQKNKWILKPNKQGGTNNLFGEQSYQRLIQLPSQQRKNYILQRWIDSPLFKNITIFRGNKLVQKNFTYQLSRFGTISVIDGEIIHNKTTGNAIRTRAEGQLQQMIGTGEDSYVSWRERRT